MLGPNYSYADEIRTPPELGISRGGDFGDIEKAVAGINFYVDNIGFGNPTGLAKKEGMNAYPLGIRYFMKTGSKCSNGQDMYEYIDTIPKPMGGRMGNAIQQSLGVKFQGLAPGIMQDAAGALNPTPLFEAVAGTGYARCKQMEGEVGDDKGLLQSSLSGTKWITDSVDGTKGGKPFQRRWVFDKYVSQDEYAADRKAAGVEGFVNFQTNSKLAAGLLIGALVAGALYSSL
jgi:hypothetical protein